MEAVRGAWEWFSLSDLEPVHSWQTFSADVVTLTSRMPSGSSVRDRTNLSKLVLKDVALCYGAERSAEVQPFKMPICNVMKFS